MTVSPCEQIRSTGETINHHSPNDGDAHKSVRGNCSATKSRPPIVPEEKKKKRHQHAESEREREREKERTTKPMKWMTPIIIMSPR